MAEQIVVKTGYVVTVKDKDGNHTGGVLVRVKDGKALVAAIPQ
jgi:hypothetical protein